MLLAIGVPEGRSRGLSRAGALGRGHTGSGADPDHTCGAGSPGNSDRKIRRIAPPHHLPLFTCQFPTPIYHFPLTASPHWYLCLECGPIMFQAWLLEGAVQNSGLFATVASKDFLGFGSGESLNSKKVSDWLDFNKEDVAKIASVSKSSVRWDDAMPKAVAERMEEIANIANLVAGVLANDPAKTALWFRTKNPMLGDLSPRDMLRLGRYERLRRYVISAIAEQP